MTQEYPAEKRYKYPHLMLNDIEIWERFLAKHPKMFETVEYDVRVGEGVDVGEAVDPDLQEMYLHLTKKRIDVVAHTAARTTIIEVKPEASIAAIGQVISYEVLYRRDVTDPRPIDNMIITDTITPDMEYLCSAFGILLVIT